MQKHAEDPASVPSQPTVGDPEEGLDQEVDAGKPRRGKDRQEPGGQGPGRPGSGKRRDG